MKQTFFILFNLFLCSSIYCQSEVLDSALVAIQKTSILNNENTSRVIRVELEGEKVSALVDGVDTLYISALENVNISSPRSFTSKEDYLKYLRYRRYAAKVYPFAQEAIRIFREAQHVTHNMKKRKRKKYLKKLSKELQKEFEDPLTKLSKTQGKIMVKMIEKELKSSMFDLIKMVQGKWKAFYWNQSSKLYGYRLKSGYVEGQNPILDVVLQDFDISYTVKQSELSQ